MRSVESFLLGGMGVISSKDGVNQGGFEGTEEKACVSQKHGCGSIPGMG